jgi:hypothetical protein
LYSGWVTDEADVTIEDTGKTRDNFRSRIHDIVGVIEKRNSVEG